MPYCPKCDMEFIDGITKCSDCGGPLVESEEVAKAIQKNEQLKRQRAQAGGPRPQQPKKPQTAPKPQAAPAPKAQPAPQQAAAHFHLSAARCPADWVPLCCSR